MEQTILVSLVELRIGNFCSTVEIGYCDYHLETKIGYYDHLSTFIWVFDRKVYVTMRQKLNIMTIFLPCPEVVTTAGFYCISNVLSKGM